MSDDFENVENVESGELDTVDGEKKERKTREVVPLLNIGEYEILLAPTCFTLKLPENRFGGYFTTLGGVIREISNARMKSILSKQPAEDKKSVLAFEKIIGEHEEFVRDITRKFDTIVPSNIKVK